MSAEEAKRQGVGRWGRLAAGWAIVAAFCALVLWGLGWGVPSRRRAELEGASKLALKVRQLPKSAVERSWEFWRSHGRDAEAPGGMDPAAWEQLRRRHLYNPIRSYHPDEYLVFKSLSNMRPGRLDFDPKNYIYPSLHTYVVGAVEGACALMGVVRLRPLDYYFEHPDELGRMYLIGRALSLLAAAATLLLVWRLGNAMRIGTRGEGRGASEEEPGTGRRDWGTGLVALALLAAMPAFGIHSHNLTRDTSTALAAVAFFMCCRKLNETGAAKWYDIAGGAAGLCVALQYFAVVLWVLIPLAALLRFRREGGSRRELATGIAVSLVMMAAVFSLVCPYHLLRFGQFLKDFGSETGHVGGGLGSRLLSLSWATHLPAMMPALMTWPMALAVGLGVAWALVRRQDDDWLLLAWLAAWAVVVGLDGRAYSRYYVGLLPALAVIGARGLVATRDAAGRLVRVGWGRAAISALALIAVLGPAAAMTWAWSRLYALENVRTLAGNWIARRIDAGATIGVTEWPWQYEMPPLDAGKYHLIVLRASPEDPPHDLARLLQLKPQPHFFVTSSIQYGTMPGREAPQDEKGRFWHFLLVSGQMYRIAAEFRVPHPILGADASGLPEDMRYVNPVIYVLELTESVARAGEAEEDG
jgi:hypothetical protein